MEWVFLFIWIIFLLYSFYTEEMEEDFDDELI